MGRGQNAVSVFHSAFEDEAAPARFSAAYREFETNCRDYRVIIASARK